MCNFQVNSAFNFAADRIMLFCVCVCVCMRVCVCVRAHQESDLTTSHLLGRCLHHCLNPVALCYLLKPHLFVAITIWRRLSFLISQMTLQPTPEEKTEHQERGKKVPSWNQITVSQIHPHSLKPFSHFQNKISPSLAAVNLGNSKPAKYNIMHNCIHVFIHSIKDVLYRQYAKTEDVVGR